MSAIDRARHFSKDNVQKIRDAIKEAVPAEEMVLMNGSFARLEASSGSDIDFSIVTCNKETVEPDWAAKDVK